LFIETPIFFFFFFSDKVMGEQQISVTVPRDRTDEQAILALKKGAQLLKCRRRGNPKFCPFKLSMDEKYLIWYSGEEERQLRLSSVITIVRGQITVCIYSFWLTK
jgi:hypothetical protein